MQSKREISSFDELASRLTQDEVNRLLYEVDNATLVAALCTDSSGFLLLVRSELGKRGNAELANSLNYATSLLETNELSISECRWAQEQIVRLVNKKGILAKLQ